jgi:protein-L-isoaspartate(D-aspartate) O-methyltransferase
VKTLCHWRYRALAFVDQETPLGQGQCMLPPCIEARMLQDLQPLHKHEKVLEIGAGSGYMAALLAHRAQRVITLEINPDLVKMARANLQKAGIHNADGTPGRRRQRGACRWSI